MNLPAFALLPLLASLQVGCGLLGGVEVRSVGTSVQKPSNVALYVAVENGGGPVDDLEAKSFRIYEDDVPVDTEAGQHILGNRDGEVLEDPGSFKTKEESKLSALEYILQPELYPDLYKDLSHQVRINYYPPRGDNKEGWDNIDIFGWLGYPMQIKINFLCRDSILAAPIVLDSVLFLDLAKRAGMSGIQEWLSFYFKSPMHAPEVYPEHDLFIQLMKLKNTLRYMQGEELITHLGREYYD